MQLSENRKRNIILSISILFVIANTILIAFEQYWFSLFPAALILLAFYFLSIENIFLIITFFVPLSVNIDFKDFGLTLTIPTEPLLIGMLLVLLFKFLLHNPFDRKMLTHPVSLIIIIQIIWMLLTSITSELPLVSFKHVIARLWFVVPVYFFGTLFFKDLRRVRIFLMTFLVPLACVVIYTTIQHALRGFDGKAAHWVMDPFFNDHTAYGAVLALFLPVSIAFVLDGKGYTRSIRLLFFLLAVIVFTGVLLSVSRAAWVSIAVALVVFVIIKFKIQGKYIALGVLSFLVIGLAFQDVIITQLEKNTHESKETDFAAHAKSMSNITTDPSNMERLNRWKAGFRMVAERPFWGWGPGTYQFVYAPFQNSADLTIISTNAGDLGNIHSEYIGPICDSGILGGVIMLVLVITVVGVGLNLLRHTSSKKREYKYLIAVYLGLITYFVHGFLNNFLDTDKASVPVWGFIAIIVSAHVALKLEQDKKQVL